jgi:integrase/recombinase XerD
VTRLRKMMLDELQRRNYAQNTVRTYIKAIEEFARYFGKPPERLGPEQIREYQVHFVQGSQTGAGNCRATRGCLAISICENTAPALSA